MDIREKRVVHQTGTGADGENLPGFAHTRDDTSIISARHFARL